MFLGGGAYGLRRLLAVRYARLVDVRREAATHPVVKRLRVDSKTSGDPARTAAFRTWRWIKPEDVGRRWQRMRGHYIGPSYHVVVEIDFDRLFSEIPRGDFFHLRVDLDPALHRWPIWDNIAKALPFDRDAKPT